MHYLQVAGNLFFSVYTLTCYSTFTIAISPFGWTHCPGYTLMWPRHILFFIYSYDSGFFFNFLFQDFEDWDDVRLNIPKPAELLQLYRDAMKHPNSCVSDDNSTQTDDYVSEPDQTVKDQLHLLVCHLQLILMINFSNIHNDKTSILIILTQLFRI